jgi:hypothetical protein
VRILERREEKRREGKEREGKRREEERNGDIMEKKAKNGS